MPKPPAGPGRAPPRKDRLLAPCARLLRHLESRDDILLLTTSNRYAGHAWDTPKSTRLAAWIALHLERRRRRVVLLDVAKLRIHTCEGNISGGRGNHCGEPAARLKDGRKNPTGQHRCWASINNDDDQLHRVSRELLRSRVVVFFASARWGQTNSIYQRLLERLSWIENRVSSLGEPPIAQLEGLEAGMVLFGHNWRDAQILETQRQNFRWFGWKTPAALSFALQYARTASVESPESYLGAIREFDALVRIGRPAAR
jgi:hypothetical protein